MKYIILTLIFIAVISALWFILTRNEVPPATQQDIQQLQKEQFIQPEAGKDKG